MTLIILGQWHLSRGEIYLAASEKQVLDIDVLEAGTIGRCKDISDFEGLIVMAR